MSGIINAVLEGLSHTTEIYGDLLGEHCKEITEYVSKGKQTPPDKYSEFEDSSSMFFGQVVVYIARIKAINDKLTSLIEWEEESRSSLRQDFLGARDSYRMIFSNGRRRLTGQ